MNRIRTMVVDDSAVIRQVLSEILSSSAAIEVTAAVADPVFAMARMRMGWPDVLVLDVEMPRMDGITFLRKIMAERPTPVVICSTLTTRGAQTTLRALSAGAVAVVAKPRVGAREQLRESAAHLVETVVAAAHANVRNLIANRPAAPSPRTVAPPVQRAGTARGIVAIGASTGGTVALERVLSGLPLTACGILVVQHMPEKFTAAFAERLDSVCGIQVREARDGDKVAAGQALIAPGGQHMALRDRGDYYVEVRNGPLVNRHCPSIDVLFRSVAAAAGPRATGVLMTGMGDDGAQGLLEMRNAGARTIAQDEASCVVFGMPKEAIRLGAAQRIGGLDVITAQIVQASR